MMASRMAARTPSPPPAEELLAPSAPRYGYQDDYLPYPKPSRSTRSSTQRNRTPSPPTSRQRPLASPRGARRANNQSNAAMVSPVPSPRKKRQPPADTSGRSVSGSLTAQNIANAAAALSPFDLAPTSNPVTSSVRASSSRSGGMLPTPSKTPSKSANKKTAAEISSFARNLFPSDDSALRRKPKSYSGIGMDSFTADQDDEPIEIFTDTKDSIPEIDTSDDNPFYTGPSKQETQTSPRRSRRKVVIPGEGSQSLEDATHREDGMVYVFRGKKFWRKFANETEEEMDQDARLARPLTRSSVKPRLLFPPKQPEQSEMDVEDEEAATDVEDEVKERIAGPIPQTPVKSHKETAKTPEAPRYAPVSPPETRRTTRSTNKLSGDETPIKIPKRQASLFDAWPRTKEHKATPTKRAGEGLASAPAKRTRA